MILAIDPGRRMTGWVLLEPQPGPLPRLVEHGNTPTSDFLERLRAHPALGADRAVAEHVGHYGTGMAAGADVFETCIFLGQMIEILRPLPVAKVRRQSVKTHLCGRPTAKDANVRQALIDRWGGDLTALGGKRCRPCKGKGWSGRGRVRCTACGGHGWDVSPGPLYGVAQHAWSALAVGIYYLEKGDDDAC